MIVNIAFGSLRRAWRQNTLAACVLITSFTSLFLLGCAARERLTFPASPAVRDARGMWYQVHAKGAADFALLNDCDGRLRTLAYDDDCDGRFDRFRQVGDQTTSGDETPHLIIMLDSIPYQAVAEQYAAGRFTWFDPPQKVIPPFPTMSGVIFTSIMHAPRLPGMINRYYDRSLGQTQNLIARRALGYTNPWHDRLHYRAEYWETGLAFLWPRYWYKQELARAKRTFDERLEPVTVVYLASTSGMLSRLGEPGLNQVLDGVEQLCCQILYERAGAVHISILADHGHTLVPATRISLDDSLKAAGFRSAHRVEHERDVVVENDGMVNYIGMHTRQPGKVADAVLIRPEVQLAIYLEGERIIVRNRQGAAAIEHRNGQFRYVPVNEDVLDYAPVLQALRGDGKIDAQGFVADRDWLEATVDHEWPDAPPRLWKAFDNLVTNTPDLMLTLNDEYCTGLGILELFISMASTHGGLNQVNSATFLLSTTGRALAPLRSDEVLSTIAPGLLEQFDSASGDVGKAMP